MAVLKQVKFFFLGIYKAIFNAYYQVLSLAIPIHENKFVFIVSRSGELEGNLKYVHDEIITQRPTAEIHLISPVNKMNLKLFKELFAIAGAKYLILDDYFLPLYLIKPRKSLKVIQLWHGAGAFKKFGYSTVDKKFGPDPAYLKIVPVHSNYTHVYVSSSNAVKHYAEAFHMPAENIYPLGIPRTDLFTDREEINKTIEKIKNRYDAVDYNKVIVLFVPTYRASNKQKESNIDFVEILADLTLHIGQDKIIVFKPHPYIDKKSLERLKGIKNLIIAEDYSVNEWMLVSDAFITDYSSAIFEFALLKKPLAHFVPDLEEYEEGRGLYYPIEEISDGQVIKKTDQLILWINSRQKNESYNTQKMLDFNFSSIVNTSHNITKHFLS